MNTITTSVGVLRRIVGANPTTPRASDRLQVSDLTVTLSSDWTAGR